MMRDRKERRVLYTVNPVFLTVLYFSNLDTNQNLTFTNFGEQKIILITYNIIIIMFTSLCANILALLSCLRNS